MHILVHFCYSILKFHKLWKNQYFLILKKPNESSFSLGLFPLFEIICNFRLTEITWLTFHEDALFKFFFQNEAKTAQNLRFFSIND